MAHVPTEQLPLLAGVALGAAVLLVLAIPLVRDPAAVAALEGPASGEVSPAAGNVPAAAADPKAGGATVASARQPGAPAPKGRSTTRDDAQDDDRSLLEKSDVSADDLAAATTVDQLTHLAREHPSDARVLGKLARAQAATPDGVGAALTTLKALFSDSPRTREDKDLQAIVTRAANGPRAVQEQALALMSTGMGSVGPDLLYELTTAPNVGKPVKQKALDRTKLEDVRKLASPALLVALDLRDHPGCARKNYLEQAEKVGDKRSLGFLLPLQPTNGCGMFFDKTDCYACLGNRAELNRAIQAIKAR